MDQNENRDKKWWSVVSRTYIIAYVQDNNFIHNTIMLMWFNVCIKLQFIYSNRCGVRHHSDTLSYRNKKITWTMFVVCLGGIICCVPHQIVSILFIDRKHNSIYNVSLGLNWMQYAFNIVIYAGQRDQYWKAYKDYIGDILNCTVYKSKTQDNKAEHTSCNSKNYIYYNF